MNSGIRMRRRVLAGTGALALVGAALVFTDSSARAEVSSDYELVAAASVFEIHIADNSLPVTQTVDASPYGASATMSSSGVVKADAGAPYAPFGYSLPSTATGLGAGSLPSIPPFPGYVAASYPANATDEEKTGGYELVAHTEEHSALGQVKLGGQQVGSPDSTGYAVAESVANDDGTVTVSGASGAAAFTFGGVLDLARVSSVLTMTKSQTGKPVVGGSTDLGTVTLASNFSSGVKDDSSLVFGQPIPLTPSSIESLNAALASSGLKLTYLPRSYEYADGSTSTGAQPVQTKTVRTIHSGGLQVSSTQNVPTQGVVDVIYTFGRVTLTASNGAAGSATSGADVLDNALDSVTPGVANAIGQTPAGVVDAVTGVVPPLGTAGAVGEIAGVPTVQFQPGAVTGERISLANRAETDGASAYLMLVIAAIGALAAAQLVRFCSVK